jgi:hypothetical protein
MPALSLASALLADAVVRPNRVFTAVAAARKVQSPMTAETRLAEANPHRSEVARDIHAVPGRNQ